MKPSEGEECPPPVLPGSAGLQNTLWKPTNQERFGIHPCQWNPFWTPEVNGSWPSQAQFQGPTEVSVHDPSLLINTLLKFEKESSLFIAGEAEEPLGMKMELTHRYLL